jgi:hypothetical protein
MNIEFLGRIVKEGRLKFPQDIEFGLNLIATKELNFNFSYQNHSGEPKGDVYICYGVCHAKRAFDNFSSFAHIFLIESTFFRSAKTLDPQVRCYINNEYNQLFLDQLFWENKFEDLVKVYPNYQDWDQQGDHIVVYLNRQFGGQGNQGLDQYEWAKETVLTLSKYTDRPIFVKHHPEGGPIVEGGISRFYDIFEKLNQELKNKILTSTSFKPIKIPPKPWAVVSFNSSAPYNDFLHGSPMFVTGPDCCARDFSSGSLKDIENPNYNVDKKGFVEYCSKLHWTKDQLMNGQFANAFMNFIKNNPKK